MSTPAEIAAEAVDATFEAFGVAATYTPPLGSAVACTVIKDSADRDMAFGNSRPIVEGKAIEVRKSEVALPVKNGVFAIGADSFTIVNDPETPPYDAERLVWRMTVR